MGFMDNVVFTTSLTAFVFCLCSAHHYIQEIPCSKAKCRGASECENLNNDYVCHCPAGVYGRHCEYLTTRSTDLCASSPCWHGGTCVSSYNRWACICPTGKTGTDCRKYTSMQDLVIKVGNRGWYICDLTLFYRRYSKMSEIVKQTGSILLGQDYAFYMHYDVDLSSTILVADAVAGANIFTINIKSSPECFHVWGTTLGPVWSPINCW